MDEEPEPIDRERINLSTRLCAYRTAIAAIDIALWAEKERIPHNWRFKELCEPAITNKPAPAIPYTEELQAAIDAYEAVRGNPEATQGRTPKQALLSWLEENRPNLGAKARDRIATMCNWEPQGGAPATPTGRGSE
ncbi:hypothetical protein CO611_06605 [Lysobacteraceae bacterium NML03-0222]|nr:hypothetical protein CO611_06605 [Xanthomonadaceae bacterium NML03-0222]